MRNEIDEEYRFSSNIFEDAKRFEIPFTDCHELLETHASLTSQINKTGLSI